MVSDTDDEFEDDFDEILDDTHSDFGITAGVPLYEKKDKTVADGFDLTSTSYLAEIAVKVLESSKISHRECTSRGSGDSSEFNPHTTNINPTTFCTRLRADSVSQESAAEPSGSEDLVRYHDIFQLELQPVHKLR